MSFPLLIDNLKKSFLPFHLAKCLFKFSFFLCSLHQLSSASDCPFWISKCCAISNITIVISISNQILLKFTIIIFWYINKANFQLTGHSRLFIIQISIKMLLTLCSIYFVHVFAIQFSVFYILTLYLHVHCLKRFLWWI